MTQVKAYTPGLYARATEQDRDAARQDFLSAQRESGMDYFSDGLLEWEDLSAPLSKLAGAAVPDAGPGESLGEPYFRSSELPRGRWFATLPSPLALAHDAEIPARRAADLLSPQVAWLADNGCAFVVLQEARMPDEQDLASLEEAVEALQSPLPLILRLPTGDASGTIPDALALPVEAVGVDMISTAVEALPEPFPKTLLAGVVDSGDPQPEEPSEVAARYESLLRRLDGEADLHLAPTGDPRALAPEAAERKVRVLGDAARILRGG